MPLPARVEWGYSGARVTGRGADSGVDVVSARAVAQVKQESYQTGRPALQRLHGAHGEDRSRDLLFLSPLPDTPGRRRPTPTSRVSFV